MSSYSTTVSSNGRYAVGGSGSNNGYNNTTTVSSNGWRSTNHDQRQHAAVAQNPFVPQQQQPTRHQQQQQSYSTVIQRQQQSGYATTITTRASNPYVGTNSNTTNSTPTAAASTRQAQQQQHAMSPTATTLAKAPPRNVSLPNPPVPLAQQELLVAFQSWISSGEQAMGSYRTRVQDWCEREKEACANDVSKLQEQIKTLERQIRERKDAAAKKIGPVMAEASEWVKRQGQRLSDAKRTMEILSGGGSKQKDDEAASSLPNELVCPITLELMKDPVIAADGHTYERAAIEQVFQRAASRHRQPVSPCTNLPLESSNLIPNVGIRSMCRRWESKAGAAGAGDAAS